MINAKTLEKIVTFRATYGLEVVKEIIMRKIFYQFYIISKKDRSNFYKERIYKSIEVKQLFVIEALAGREYWNNFKKLTLNKCVWYGRKPHNNDPINKLLDIGYHHLVEVIKKIFDDIDLPYELGLLHKAQNQNSKPLIYDFMEWLRPITVDRVLFITIKKERKILEKISQKDIAIFVNKIKQQLDRTFYHKKLGYCITLKYWIRLNALGLLSQINHNEFQKFYFPSLRHESRCKKKNPNT